MGMFYELLNGHRRIRTGPPPLRPPIQGLWGVISQWTLKLRLVPFFLCLLANFVVTLFFAIGWSQEHSGNVSREQSGSFLSFCVAVWVVWTVLFVVGYSFPRPWLQVSQSDCVGRTEGRLIVLTCWERKLGTHSDTHVRSVPDFKTSHRSMIDRPIYFPLTGNRRQGSGIRKGCKQVQFGDVTSGLITDGDRSTSLTIPVYKRTIPTEVARGYGIQTHHNEEKSLQDSEHPVPDAEPEGASRPAEPSAPKHRSLDERRLPLTVVPPRSWQDRYRAQPSSLTLKTSMDRVGYPHRSSLDSSAHTNHFPRTNSRPPSTRRAPDGVRRGDTARSHDEYERS